MSSASEQPPGWYPDPSDGEQVRWWDGTAWTDQAQPAGAPLPQRPETRSGGRLVLKVALISIGIFVGLGVLAVGTCLYYLNTQY